MSHCSELENCSYFNEVLASMPTVADLMKTRYCMGDKDSCARVIVASTLGGSHVPRDLAPNNNEEARQIIRRNRSV